MTFEDFAAERGLIINHIEFGRWVRVPTEDHPHKRNGAYFHGGDIWHVQNWATQDSPDTSFLDDKKDSVKFSQMRETAKKKSDNGRDEAAKKAEWIISKSVYEQHAYFDAKGWPDKTGLVWRPNDKTNLLVIPMRKENKIVGCQLIDKHGSKKFLKGQTTKGAEYLIGTTGPDFWCEGLATGLSVHECMRGGARVHICFSAHNMQKMAKTGFVITDNDVSGVGERAAIEAGLNYFMPPLAGQDFNDYHLGLGTFKASQELKKFLIKCNQEKYKI